MSSSQRMATRSAKSTLPNGASQSSYPENKTQKHKQSSKQLEGKGHKEEQGEEDHEEEDEDHSDHQHMSEEWPIESQKVKDEQIQAFYREYAKVKISLLHSRHCVSLVIRAAFLIVLITLVENHGCPDSVCKPGPGRTFGRTGR